MSGKLALTLAIALGAATLLTSSADAQRRGRDTFTISGCPQYRPPFCMVLTDRGTRYALGSGAANIGLNRGITARVRRVGDFGPCFAIPVEVITWRYNRMRCPR